MRRKQGTVGSRTGRHSLKDYYEYICLTFMVPKVWTAEFIRDYTQYFIAISRRREIRRTFARIAQTEGKWARRSRLSVNTSMFHF
jgi:hypothetical protein